MGKSSHLSHTLLGHSWSNFYFLLICDFIKFVLDFGTNGEKKIVDPCSSALITLIYSLTIISSFLPLLYRHKWYINIGMNQVTSLLGRLQTQTFHGATPPIGKIHQFSKNITFEPVMQFGCPLRFRISYKTVIWSFYDWKHHLKPVGRGGAVKIFSQTIS